MASIMAEVSNDESVDAHPNQARLTFQLTPQTHVELFPFAPITPATPVPWFPRYNGIPPTGVPLLLAPEKS